MRAFFLIVLLVFSGAALAQDAAGPIAVESTTSDDLAIQTRISEILDELDGFEDVTVSVREGVVRLEGTTPSSVERGQLQQLVTRIDGVVTVQNDVTETAEISRRINPALDRFQERFAQLVAFLPLALIGVAVFTVIVAAGFLIASRRQPWDRLAPNAFIAELYRQIVRIVFSVLALVVALDVVNAAALLSTILGAAGIVGLALGFAVRDTVENYIASVLLSIRQPFRPNDVVEINGDQGKVIRLTSRATILLSFDGNHIRIPNATVYKSRIVNFSLNRERRFLFDILISRDADLQMARELIEATVTSLPFTLETPAAATWIETLEPAGARLSVAGWIDQSETSILLAKGEAIRQVKLALQRAGVAITDATQVVSLKDEDKVIGVAHPTLASESAEVAEVADDQDTALEGLIAAERDAGPREDLLDERAVKE